MSLQHLINFNDNSTSPFRDMSGNGFSSTSQSGTYSLIDGDVGKALEVTGNSNAAFGDLAAFDDDLTEFSITGKLSIDSSTGSDQFIYHKGAAWGIVYRDSTGKIDFYVNTGGSAHRIKISVTLGQTFRFVAAWTGSVAKLSVDGSTYSTIAATGALNTGAAENVRMLSYNGASLYARCTIEEIRFYTQALSQAEADLVQDPDNDSGITVTTETGFPHSFEAGDLLVSDFDGDREVQVVVTTNVDANNFKILPSSDNYPTGSEIFVRCGNIYDTDRQEFAFLRTNGESPEMVFMAGISAFSNLSSTSNIAYTTSARGPQTKTVNTSANYTATDADTTIKGDSTSGDITITLPSSPTTNKEYNIVKVNSGNAVIISANGNNIVGGSNFSLFYQYSAVIIKWCAAASEWYILGSYIPVP